MAVDLESVPSLNQLSPADRKSAKEAYTNLGQHFGIEVSPSNRSKCRACSTNIPAQELRVRHLTCSHKCRRSQRDTCGNYHVECFFRAIKERKDDFTFTDSEFKFVGLENLAGSTKLVESDKERFQKLLSMSIDEIKKVPAREVDVTEEPAAKKQKIDNELETEKEQETQQSASLEAEKAIPEPAVQEPKENNGVAQQEPETSQGLQGPSGDLEQSAGTIEQSSESQEKSSKPMEHSVESQERSAEPIDQSLETQGKSTVEKVEKALQAL